METPRQFRLVSVIAAAILTVGALAFAQNMDVAGSLENGSVVNLNNPSGDLLHSTNTGIQAFRLTNDNITGVNNITINDTGAGEGLDFQAGRNISIYESAYGGYPAFVFNSSSTYPYVLSGGNVGIGTTAPAETLHVNGWVRGNQSGALRVDTGNGWTDYGPKNSSWAHFYTDRDRFYFDKEIRVDSGLIGTYNQDLQLRTQGTTRVTVYNSNGDVGIGNTTPGAELDVNNYTRFGRGIADSWFPYTGNGYAYISGNGIIFREGSAGGYTERMRVADNGFVGIGTTNPVDKLTVTGKIHSTSGGLVFPDGTVQSTAVFCGNGVCSLADGESCHNCPTDCGSCASCGDGTCNGSETCSTCSLDCGPCSYCGDGSCNGSETSTSCPEDCGGSCFVAGTPIRMADGSEKAIEEIRAGDTVLAYDELTGRAVSSAVTQTFVHQYRGDLVRINDRLEATTNHPFWAGGAWVEAGQLAQGDQLITLPGTGDALSRIHPVQSLTRRAVESTVYNFTVAKQHTYFAAGVLVHNKPIIPE